MKHSFPKVCSSFLNAVRFALDELSPHGCVKKALRFDDNANTLYVRHPKNLHDAEHHYAFPLRHGGGIHLIAFGKAAASMVAGAEAILGSRLTGGIASVPVGTVIPEKSVIQFFPGAEHNLPDAAAVETASKIRKYVEGLTESDFVIFLVSGGGSALLPDPVEGVSLAEKTQVIKALAQGGATIQELNTVRIALSRVKGGRLAAAVKGHSVSLIISDIVGDPIELIASGPTVLPEATGKRTEPALHIVRRLVDDVPASVLQALENPPPPPTSTLHPDDQTKNFVIASNRLLTHAILDYFANHYTPGPDEPFIACGISSTTFTGDATDAGAQFFEVATNQYDSQADKWSLNIYAGETTVTFPAGSNLKEAHGGRNQEVALSFLRNAIERHRHHPSASPTIGIIALGTDGQDGPTDAAGAFVSDEDIRDLNQVKLHKLGHSVDAHLAAKTSYDFWAEFNAGANHIKTGKTGHNMMDVYAVAFYHHK